MVQINLEIISNLLVFIAYIIITIICIIKGIGRKNPPLLIFSLFLAGWMFGTGFQTLAYMVVIDNLVLALKLKVVAAFLIMSSTVIWFIWIDYVQFERVRPWAVIPIFIIATLYFNAIISPGAFQIDTYIENEIIIGVSISKVGAAQILDAIGVGLVYFSMAWYFATQIRHAPPKLKPITVFLTVFIIISLVTVIIINGIVRSIPANQMAMILYSLTMLINAIITCVLIIAIILVPQTLYILAFKVSRLMVIEERSGVALFDYKFSEHDVDIDLFSGLLQGFQAISAEVLQQGALKEIRLENGNLCLLKYPHITLGLISSRSSRFLAQCLERFANAFEDRFHDKLVDFKGEIADMMGSVDLVDEIFEYIPRYNHQKSK